MCALNVPLAKSFQWDFGRICFNKKKKEEKRKRKEIDLPYLRDANCIIGTTYLDFLMQRANFAKHYKSCTTFLSCCEKQSESDIINSRWYLI